MATANLIKKSTLIEVVAYSSEVSSTLILERRMGYKACSRHAAGEEAEGSTFCTATGSEPRHWVVS